MLDWDRVSFKKAKQKVIRMFKAPNNIAPGYLTRIFKDHEAPYEKRLAIPKPRSNLYQEVV